jgi:hypothetical protein
LIFWGKNPPIESIFVHSFFYFLGMEINIRFLTPAATLTHVGTTCNAGLAFALLLFLQASLPGSLARQPCPAALPGSLARQPCPAALPSSLARQPCPAALHKYYKF